MKENGGSQDEIERCSELANKSTSQRDVKKVNKIDDKAGRVYPTQKTKGKLSILHGENLS